MRKYTSFFPGVGQQKDKFDIYNQNRKTWSIGVLPQRVESAAIISINNTVLWQGGKMNGIVPTRYSK